MALTVTYSILPVALFLRIGTYASGAITSTGSRRACFGSRSSGSGGSGAPGGIVASLLSSFGPFGDVVVY